MATNPYNNKVELSDGTVLMDLTGDTVTPNDLLVGVTAHDRSGAAITGTVAVASPASNISPRSTDYTGAVGVSTAYAREDHKHPMEPIKAGTYNNTQAAIYNSYLSFVESRVAEITDDYGYYYVPFYASSTTGWPSSTYGVGHVYKFGENIVVFAEAINGDMYTNIYTSSAWIGWSKLAKNSEIPEAATSNPSRSLSDQASIGSSTKYAKEDHVHPIPGLLVATYNNNQQTAHGSYLSFVLDRVATLTSTTDVITMPCTASPNAVGWPENVTGIGRVFKYNTYIMIIAELINGNVYSNAYTGSAWTGWQLLTPDAAVNSELSFNNGGTLTTSLSGATLSRAAVKRAGQVYTISAEISGISQDLNGVQILNLSSGYAPLQATYIYGFFTAVIEEIGTQTENIVSGATLTDGKAIVVASGAETSRTGYTDTDYIPVENGKTYTVSPVFNGSYGFAFYKADKTYISGLASTDANKTFVTPWNAEYARLTVATNQKSNFKLNRVDKVSKETKIIAPILLDTSGYAYAYPPSGYTYTKVELAGAYGHHLT